jgi:tetratricopeptide (TPR) repeat protein
VSNRLAQVRAERGWKKVRLIHELRAAAARRGERLVKDESLSRRIAVWENQDGVVGELYRDLLCEIYGMSAAELGLVELPSSEPAPEAAELEQRLTFSRLDGGLVELLRGQTQSIRLLDRRLGGAAIFQQTSSHVANIESLLRFALPSAERDAAADELSQAAALAGWQALDMGKLEEAWRLHEVAKSAARESGVTAGLSYASAQQAYVLLDHGQPEEALRLVKVAQTQAGSRVPPALRSWLSSAEGEVLATLGQRDGALRALDEADAALPDDPDHEGMPYLMLDSGHLARWRGNCLARLGEASAIDSLTSALDTMGEGHYGRAEASLRVDLALAFQARGDSTVARLHARRAAEVAGRTGSQRQRRRIAELLNA